MDRNDLEFLRNYRRKESPPQAPSDDSLWSFVAELLFPFALYGAGLAFFWFLSQMWSWIVFLAAGLFFMIGVPAYFLLRRK